MGFYRKRLTAHFHGAGPCGYIYLESHGLTSEPHQIRTFQLRIISSLSAIVEMQKRINIQQTFVSDLRDSIQSGIGCLVDFRTSSGRSGIGLSHT